MSALDEAVERGRLLGPVTFDGEPGVDPFPYLAQYERLYEVVGDLRLYAWGTMVYACVERKKDQQLGCGWEHRVAMGVGVEGPPVLRDLEQYIPAPFIAGKCPKCYGALSHVRWSEDEGFEEPNPLLPDQPAFVVPEPSRARALAGRHYGGGEYIGQPAVEPQDVEPQEGDDEPYMRCIKCALVVTKGEIRKGGMNRCPRCQTKSTPVKVEDDVEVKVNWHELRILGIWAERWAAQLKGEDPSMQRLINVICGRLHAQHPERGGLTMTSELTDVEREVGPIETDFPMDEEAREEDR